MRTNLRHIVAATVIAVCFFAFSVATAQDISYPGGSYPPLTDPQAYFNDSNLPSMPNSLFPITSPSNNDVKVTITNTGDNIRGHVYGGIAMGTRIGGIYQKEDSLNNVVTINVTTGQIGMSNSGGNVTGGWSLIGDVKNNEVLINNGPNGIIYNIIFGGWIRGDGDARTNGSIAEDNRVIINGGSIRDNVYGAYTQESLGKLLKNTVTINGGSFTKNGSIIVGGYSALGVNEVDDNRVTINGGTFTNTSIYGGRGQTTSAITNNKVIISGGTISAGEIYGAELIRGSGTGAEAGKVTGNEVTISGGTIGGAQKVTIYGGYGGAAAVGNTNAVTGNKVTISGGSVTGDIYGGYSAGSGPVTGNIVTISGASTIVKGDLYGGFGRGNVFDGNTLNLTSFHTSSAFGTVRNFQYINFGFTGNANIGTLDTTPTGSALDGVTVNTQGNDVIMDGLITGSGDLAKAGAGTLILTANSVIGGDIEVTGGTLQLGNGGNTGSIATTKVNGFFGLSNNAILAYDHAIGHAYEENRLIAGNGKIVLKGGELTLNLKSNLFTNNMFTGGTEIESGILNIVDSYSYNTASGSLSSGRGYITFTGAERGDVIVKGDGLVAIDVEGVHVSGLINSFRTQAGAGHDNFVDMTGVEALVITDVHIAGSGGAFYVAGGGPQDRTTMTVNAHHLFMIDNRASGTGNDIYVEGGGTFNLNVTHGAAFASGIDGHGTLNMTSTGDPRSVALVRFDPSRGATFSMDTTNVKANAETTLVLDLMGGLFQGSHEFNLGGSGHTALIGGGVVMLGSPFPPPVPLTFSGTINVTDGAMLALVDGMANMTPTTLLLWASHVNLDDFSILYRAGATDSRLVIFSPNPAILGEGVVAIIPPFDRKDHLVIQSAYFPYFVGTNGLPIVSDNDLHLTATSDGFIISSSGGTPRGSYGFHLGGAPDAEGKRTPGIANVWLSNSLNSLTMNWVGGDANWRSGDGNQFESVQENAGIHEKQFMSGDKVIVNNTSSTLFEIEVPAGVLGNNITVSGLVVDGTADVTFYGDGGITADKTSAFGDYVNSGTADELIPTGKLEKSGNNTLTFANTGSNLFMDGIDISGGTIAFNQANQLSTGTLTFPTPGTPPLEGVPTNDKPITFTGNNATLHALDTVTIENEVNVANGITTANIEVADGKTWTHTGTLTGSSTSTLYKRGEGTLWLTGSVDFGGNVTVTAGTLSGTGRIGDTVVTTGATLKPDGLTKYDVDDPTIPPEMNPLTVSGNLTFEEESIFDVRIVPTGGTRTLEANDQVLVSGTVNIDPTAELLVAVDYWGGATAIRLSDRFTIIDGMKDDASADEFGSLGLAQGSRLPRGISMEQGWSSENDLFQLWFDFNEEDGFGNLCIRHNRREIGKTMDWFIVNGASGIQDLLDRLSDPDLSDAEVCKQLDQLHGDLTPNAMFMALKEPWRHPFNRLTLTSTDSCSPCAPLTNGKSVGRQLWGEFTARYENVGFDRNAHAFTINRYGLAVGVDQRVSHRSIVGATFQHAEPRLRQETGKVKMDDCEFGLYGMTRLADDVDVKAYLGYSHQRYGFDRYVWLPETGTYEALSEHLSGKTSGDALAASVELLRSFKWRKGVRVLPVAAFDYERVWMRGYRESGGTTALVYDNATLDRLMIRVGLGSEWNLGNRLALNTRLQYAAQLNNREYSAIGARFAQGPAEQHTADIWGSQIGRDYLNFGIGTNWKLDTRRHRLLYVNYDAKWFDRANSHVGETGFVTRW